MRDEKVARRLKRTLESVKGRRRKLRIPVFAPKRRNWPAEEDKLIGTLPDAEIARRFGRSLDAVGMRRRQLSLRSIRSA
jgi:hypothetical protein